jgi:hypothetical protein
VGGLIAAGGDVTMAMRHRARALLSTVLLPLVFTAVAAVPSFGVESAGLKVVLEPCGEYRQPSWKPRLISSSGESRILE